MKKIILILALALSARPTVTKAAPGMDIWLPQFSDSMFFTAFIIDFYFGDDLSTDPYIDALRSITLEDLIYNVDIYSESVAPANPGAPTAGSAPTDYPFATGIDCCTD